MKKEKQIRTYQRRTKTGKLVTVKAHTAKYDAAEELKKAMQKKGAGEEISKKKSEAPQKSEFPFTAEEFKEWYHWDLVDDPKNAAAKKVEKALKAQMGTKAYKKFFDEVTENYSPRGHNKALKTLEASTKEQKSKKDAEIKSAAKDSTRGSKEKSTEAKASKTSKKDDGTISHVDESNFWTKAIKSKKVGDQFSWSENTGKDKINYDAQFVTDGKGNYKVVLREKGEDGWATGIMDDYESHSQLPVKLRKAAEAQGLKFVGGRFLSSREEDGKPFKLRNERGSIAADYRRPVLDSKSSDYVRAHGIEETIDGDTYYAYKGKLYGERSTKHGHNPRLGLLTGPSAHSPREDVQEKIDSLIERSKGKPSSKTASKSAKEDNYTIVKGPGMMGSGFAVKDGKAYRRDVTKKNPKWELMKEGATQRKVLQYYKDSLDTSDLAEYKRAGKSSAKAEKAEPKSDRARKSSSTDKAEIEKRLQAHIDKYYTKQRSGTYKSIRKWDKKSYTEQDLRKKLRKDIAYEYRLEKDPKFAASEAVKGAKAELRGYGKQTPASIARQYGKDSKQYKGYMKLYSAPVPKNQKKAAVRNAVLQGFGRAGDDTCRDLLVANGYPHTHAYTQGVGEVTALAKKYGIDW